MNGLNGFHDFEEGLAINTKVNGVTSRHPILKSTQSLLLLWIIQLDAPLMFDILIKMKALSLKKRK